MPARTTIPDGAPIWNDLGTPDLTKSIEFYGQLFGWTYENYGEEFGNYGAFSKDGHLVAGVGPLMSDDQPTTWTVYLKSTDIAKTVGATKAAGGQVIADTMEVPGKGHMAVVVDPAGAVFGLWQPGGMDGFELADEADAPVWHELLTRSYAPSVDFYTNVLGWTTEVQGDTDDFRYIIQKDGDDQLAGIMDASGFLPEGVPSHWGVYFGTNDTDATVARAVELGATVVQEAENTPYGRMASLTDPTGAVFKVISVLDQ